MRRWLEFHRQNAEKGGGGALNYITVRKILKGNMNLMKREMEAIKKNQVELLEKEIQYLK